MSLIIFLVVYFISCYILYRIGAKFELGSMKHYFIPIYNGVLICRCAGVSGRVIIGLLIPYINLLFGVYVYGNLAKRLGKNFWLYGLTYWLLIPILILALGDSKPVEAKETWVAEVVENEPVITSPVEATVESIKIYGVSGEYVGECLELPKEGIVIGSDPVQSNLIINSNKIVAAHAKIIPDLENGGDVLIKSLGGSIFIQEVDNSVQGWHWEQIQGTRSISTRNLNRLRIEDIDEFEVRR